MAQRRISKVVVLGASGNTGPAVVDALLGHPAQFEVSIVTRDKSKVSFPSVVKVFESDYSPASLKDVFAGQDAVVSTLAASTATEQDAIIDVAIEANVVRFLPTEFGVDTSNPERLNKFMPVVNSKPKVVQYLRSKENKISWTVVVVGSFFDWSLAIPGMMGWNIPERKATIFDGGDKEYEVTNVPQIGRAVAAMLSPEHQNETANQYVYVNSFTLTQNKVLAALEKATGDKFDITQQTTAELHKRAVDSLPEGSRSSVVDMIIANLYNVGGLNEYSKSSGGLWNDRLGLPKEDFEASVNAAVKKYSK